MELKTSLLSSMIGHACWHVSAGGVTVPSFALVMGEKVPRTRPLKNPAQPEEFRNYGGSIELLVWSSWRLQDRTTVFATSDQEGDLGVSKLDSLKGVEITGVDCLPPAWDLRIQFADGRELLTFSDHLQPGASFNENWEIWVDDCYLGAGPGAQLITERDSVRFS